MTKCQTLSRKRGRSGWQLPRLAALTPCLWWHRNVWVWLSTPSLLFLWDGATQMQDRSLPSVHPAHAESLSDELCYSLCFSVQSGGIQSSHPSFTQHSSLRLSHIAACRRTACITVSNSVSPSPNNGYLSYFHILLL